MQRILPSFDCPHARVECGCDRRRARRTILSRHGSGRVSEAGRSSAFVARTVGTTTRAQARRCGVESRATRFRPDDCVARRNRSVRAARWRRANSRDATRARFSGGCVDVAGHVRAGERARVIGRSGNCSCPGGGVSSRAGRNSSRQHNDCQRAHHAATPIEPRPQICRLPRFVSAR